MARTLSVFNSVSIDGYFTDETSDMSWAHDQDPEWNKFIASNASGEAELVFGRKTYEMMARFWPTQRGRTDDARGRARHESHAQDRVLAHARVRRLGKLARWRRPTWPPKSAA